MQVLKVVLLLVYLLILAGCVSTGIEVETIAPTTPWRVSFCGGDDRVEVRVASVIPQSNLSATCTSEFHKGKLRATVSFDGVFNDPIKTHIVWMDKNRHILKQDNTWTREFTLGSAATRTERWEAPTPLGHFLRIDVSCTQC